MTVTEPLILFTRPGCHLCDLAAGMLEKLRISYREVNIETDSELEERYGLQVPVVFFKPAKKELLYPFGEEQLSRLLEEKC